MKKLLLIPLLVLVITGLMLSGCTAPAEEPAVEEPVVPTAEEPAVEEPTVEEPAKVITLRRAGIYSVTDTCTVIALESCKEIEKRTDGRVRFEFYPAGTLLGPKEVYEGVVKGIADMAYVAAPRYDPARFPMLSLLDMPVARDITWDGGSKAFTELVEKFKPQLEEIAGVEVLYMIFKGGGHLYTVEHPVRSCEDMKDIRMRCGGASVSFFKGMGATPTVLSVGEVSGALEKGIINGIMMGVFGIKAFELVPDPLKYMTTCELGNICSMLIVNLDTWNSLPPDIRDIMQEVFYEEWEKQATRGYAGYQEHVDWMISRGIEIEEFPPAFMECARENLQPMYDEWLADMEAKGLPGQAFLDEYLRLMAEYER